MHTLTLGVTVMHALDGSYPTIWHVVDVDDNALVDGDDQEGIHQKPPPSRRACNTCLQEE